MGNASVNTDDVQVPFLCLPAPCCQGANTCPKKEHIFFFFFSPFYLCLRQGAEMGIKEKRRQLLIRSAAVVLSPSFSMSVDVISFVFGVPS